MVCMTTRIAHEDDGTLIVPRGCCRAWYSFCDKLVSMEKEERENFGVSAFASGKAQAFGSRLPGLSDMCLKSPSLCEALLLYTQS